MKLLKYIHDILTRDLQANLEKSHGKSIKARGLITIQSSHNLKKLHSPQKLFPTTASATLIELKDGSSNFGRQLNCSE
jgi:hypothetical protein